MRQLTLIFAFVYYRSNKWAQSASENDEVHHADAKRVGEEDTWESKDTVSFE